VRVIDSSALVKYFAREEGWESVRELILEGVITLDLAIKEVANALWRKVKRGDMSANVALEIIRDLSESKAVRVMGQDEYIEDAFRIALEYGITVYDSLFIVLAERLGVELVTCDGVQGEKAVARGINVVMC
jgi:predicted nucleic acid-binding protein